MRLALILVPALAIGVAVGPAGVLPSQPQKRGNPLPNDAPDGKNQHPAHWAFSAVRQPPLPAIGRAEWCATPVDRFVLSALEARGLAPAPEADRRLLVRRLTFDLTGLPPTAAEVEAFEQDMAPDAYERVVERLLASPRYGERWGRFWLDVARYADSKGYVFLEERRYPFAYTYRDYVIRSFNHDLPYDRFIIEQLAADKLLPGKPAPGAESTQSLAAMGFLTLGRRFLNNIHDIIDDRIDVTMRGLMGLTVGCARCHDHKFDPIPQKDYYSLYGVFASSVEPRELPLLVERIPGPDGSAFQIELDRLKGEKERFEKDNARELKAGNRKFREQLTGLQKKIDAHMASHPGSPPRAMVLVDSDAPVNPHVFLRGNPGMAGEAVPRRFLEIVAGAERKPFHEGSGRLELARAIASPNNPLTARVLVNRVWGWHCGSGLVDTPSDFGVRTPPPSHPELLDWLAARFMAEGWSIKKLQRWIVLSAAYRQSSNVAPSGVEGSNPQSIDPQNRLLWHMNRRRLEFEALRDSILAVAGQLDSTVAGPPVDMIKRPFSHRRTVYGFIDRQNLPGTLRTFDFASPDGHCPMRHATTVPQQALFMLNSPFVQEQARALARRVSATTTREQIDCFYRIALSHSPSAEEVRLGMAFLGDAPSDTTRELYAQVLLASNEFLFVD
jgi:hypothetical protein